MVQEIYIERKRSSRVYHLTLTLSLGSWVMCSAHCLTNRNILVKFHENQSKGSGDKEWTRNSRVNPLTLTCDLESS